MAVIGHRIPADKFSWKRSVGRIAGSAFLSDLKKYNVFGRLYDDACDVGFVAVGHHQNVPFYLDESIRDSDDDAAVWVFRPVNSLDVDLTINIYND